MSEYVREVNDDSFEQEVLRSERPALVDFWAEWCAPCRMIAPVIEALAEGYKGSVNVFKLNVDESPSVAQRYGIKGIPTLILFQDGTEAERVVGATSKEALSRLISKHTGARAA